MRKLADRSGEIDAAYAAYDAHPLDEPDEWGDLASFRSSAIVASALAARRDAGEPFRGR